MFSRLLDFLVRTVWRLRNMIKVKKENPEEEKGA